MTSPTLKRILMIINALKCAFGEEHNEVYTLLVQFIPHPLHIVQSQHKVNNIYSYLIGNSCYGMGVIDTFCVTSGR